MKRNMWIVLVIFILAVFVSGVLFIFGDSVLDGSVKDIFFSKDSVVKSGDDSAGADVWNNVDEVGFSGEGGSEGSGGGSSDSVFICSKYQPLQYSLGSFVQDVVCLVNGTVECDKVSVKCSSELYNLDYDSGGVFGVRYSLAYSGEVLDYDVDSGNVGPRSAEVLNVEFAREGSFNVDDIVCLVDMDSVARKCVEGYWS